jgi:hypothetical protein
MPDAGSTERRAEVLVAALRAARDAHASSGPGERYVAVAEALKRELGGVPTAEADGLLAAAREVLVTEARRAAGSAVALARLSEENARLRAEIEHLRAAAGQPSADAPDAKGRSADLATLRQALRSAARKEPVDLDALASAPGERRLLALVQELLQFAFVIARFEKDFRLEHITPGMSTRIFKEVEEDVRRRFLNCLDDKEGSIAALKQLLAGIGKVPLSVIASYEQAIPQGCRAVLEHLDPEAVLNAQGKRFPSFEQAWKELRNRHASLVSLPDPEIYERYFRDRFREEFQKR